MRFPSDSTDRVLLTTDRRRRDSRFRRGGEVVVSRLPLSVREKTVDDDDKDVEPSSLLRVSRFLLLSTLSTASSALSARSSDRRHRRLVRIVDNDDHDDHDYEVDDDDDDDEEEERDNVEVVETPRKDEDDYHYDCFSDDGSHGPISRLERMTASMEFEAEMQRAELTFLHHRFGANDVDGYDDEEEENSVDGELAGLERVAARLRSELGGGNGHDNNDDDDDDLGAELDRLGDVARSLRRELSLGKEETTSNDDDGVLCENRRKVASDASATVALPYSGGKSAVVVDDESVDVLYRCLALAWGAFLLFRLSAEFGDSFLL